MLKNGLKEIIIHEDDNYVIVNKPSGLSTLDDRSALSSTSIKALAKAYWPEAQICHRLDKETTGALAIAKNPEAYRHLSMQFEDRKVVKLYHAVVEGLHDFKEQLVDAPILALKKGIVKIDRREGKDAKTTFTTIKAYSRHSLVGCKPITGRMHQIRVHLKLLNAPIVADEQYGGEQLYLSSLKRKFNLKQGTEERPLINRVALHAFALSFNLLDGTLIVIEAPYPKDFGVLVKQLDKNS